MARSKSYQSIVSQIKRLQLEADLLREREKKPILAAIAAAIHYYEITLTELRSAVGHLPGNANAGNPANAGRDRSMSNHPLAGRKIAAKYRDPKSGQTWSGRGSTPNWLRKLEESGTKRETLLIKRRKN
ncbi:MAG: H-NS histone family protein [Burkholderiales bacterium]